MLDLNDLLFFAQVVEHGGFAAASRALRIPKSKLSRRIAALEDRLGVRLIQRSTRHFAITDIGEEYLQHCRAMWVEAEAAEETIEARRAEPQGTLRVTCPIALLHVQMGGILADFMAEYPKVKVLLEGTNRRVDVITERVDVAIRARPAPLENSDLVMRVFAERRWCLAASPDLISRLGMPSGPADLEHYPILDMCPSNGIHTWDLRGPDGATASIGLDPRLVSDDMIALRAGAVRGNGMVNLPYMVLKDDFSAGRLVPLLPDWVPKSGLVHAVFASRRGVLPSVRALIDFIASRCEQNSKDDWASIGTTGGDCQGNPVFQVGNSGAA